ncbi:MAG TPA: hypothetical protein PLS66_04825 [Tepiditoga sp.]|nr:hypothetical protein [Thermotogota bacterium]HOO74595.1 hypothetical protein [Tepiditoga sp.]
MKKLLFLLFTSLFLLFSCTSSVKKIQVYFEQNAVWSEDYENIIIIGSKYNTEYPEMNFYNPYNKSEKWENIIYLSDKDLKSKTEIFRWSDEKGDNSQGWIQSIPVYYRKSTECIYYTDGDYGIIRNTFNSDYLKLALPENLIKKIFVYKGNPLYDENISVPAVEIMPSPDGVYVTVFYQFYIMTGNFTGIYISAIGIFDGYGNYITGIPLSEWNGWDYYLGNFISFPSTSPENFSAVPTARNYYVFWKNNNTFFVKFSDYSEYGAVAMVEYTINDNGISKIVHNNFDAVSAIPYYQKPTKGTFFDDKGNYIFYTENGINDFKIFLFNFQN